MLQFECKKDVLNAFLEELDVRKGQVIFFEKDEEVQGIMDGLFKAGKTFSSTPLVKSDLKFTSRKEVEAVNIEVAVGEGECGAVDGGAILLTDRAMDIPEAFFLAEHYVFVLDAKKIYPNLTAAYKEVNIRECRYSSFISGPSSTADIALTSVFGAQGPRSLHVLIKK